MDAARPISALTHGDPAAGEGCAIFHELMRVALDGRDPLAAIPGALKLVAAGQTDRLDVGRRYPHLPHQRVPLLPSGSSYDV